MLTKYLVVIPGCLDFFLISLTAWVLHVHDKIKYLNLQPQPPPLPIGNPPPDTNHLTYTLYLTDIHVRNMYILQLPLK